ncbi:hypothetical protein GCM10009613_48820 [Pseudonocardia kongjuensis]|uniref:Secreted protein n=1 Tax=Pseudonocardia kongjuensis TaxID=102227 RepID=A0ABN1Y3E7_9PSEU
MAIRRAVRREEDVSGAFMALLLICVNRPSAFTLCHGPVSQNVRNASTQEDVAPHLVPPFIRFSGDSPTARR